MYGSLTAELSRENWCVVPGRSIVYVNNKAGDPIKASYKNGDDVIFVKYYSYDESGNIVKIECKVS